MRAALAMDRDLVPFVFAPPQRERLAGLVELDPAEAVGDLDALAPDVLERLELLVTGWGAPLLHGDALDRLPRLRAVVHTGGGVGFLDGRAVDRGVAISSARSANAVPVAEYTVAMITLAAKDVFTMSRLYAREQRSIDREAEFPRTGLYGSTVGVVGASSVGLLVMEQLRSRGVEILLHDPTIPAAAASRLGAEPVDDLAELARRSRILTIHAPDIPSTRGMVSRAVLAALGDGATLVNTARGSLVDQEALVDELRSGRIRAILDVTEPEVLPAGHPLYSLSNVVLTPHVAGSMGTELRRLGELAIAEVERLVAGEPFAHPIIP